MSTKTKNRHGRVGVKRPNRLSASQIRRREGRAAIAPRTLDKKEQTEGTKRLIMAWAGRVGRKFTGHRNEGPGVQRAKAREAAEAKRREELYRNAFTKTFDYSALTVAELKKVCDDRGIEYKSRATKPQLIAMLEGS